jgi:hypothetical protein
MSENDNEEKKVVLHKVVVDRDPETDSLHEELARVKQEKAELQAMLVQATLKASEDRKEELKKKYPQAIEAIDIIENPQDLDTLAERLKQKHSHIVAGKSTLGLPSNGEDFESQRAMVDSLYRTAYYDPEKTPKEKKEAEDKIKELYGSLIEGRSWNQLRQGKSMGKRTEFQACPKCNATIDLNAGEISCYACGWKPKKGELGRE